MRFRHEVSAVITGLVAAALFPACALLDDGPTDISDLPTKEVHFVRAVTAAAGFEAQIGSQALLQGTPCPVLRDDAFARLNGAPLPLFRGSSRPFNGGEEYECEPPSVAVSRIDVRPPWHIEIGDPSQTIAITLDPVADNPIEFLPLEGATITYPGDAFVVPIAYKHEPETAVLVTGYFEFTGWSGAWDGALGASDVSFPNDVGWHQTPGPARVRLIAETESPILRACENATCFGWAGFNGPVTTRDYAVTLDCLYSFCL